MDAPPQRLLDEIRDLDQYESFTDRLKRKLLENPFLGHGLLGFAAVCAAGAYHYKRRTLPTSQYLMQLRVTAQGTAVACLTAGVAYTLYNKYEERYINKEEPHLISACWPTLTDDNKPHLISASWPTLTKDNKPYLISACWPTLPKENKSYLSSAYGPQPASFWFS